MRKMSRPLSHCLLTSTLCLAAVPVLAAPITWNGGNGDWADGANWTPASVPAGADDVFVDGGQGGTASEVEVTGSRSARSVTIDAGDRVDINNGATLTINAPGGLANSGVLAISSTGLATTLNMNGTQTITGTGEIQMADNALSRMINTNDTLTQAVGHAIRGAGQLLANTGGMVNQGTIEATGANALVIDPNGIGFSNQGDLIASGAGGLTLHGGTFNNNSETIQIATGSRLHMTTAATLIGGTVQGTGTGVLDFGASTNTLNNLTLDANTVHAEGQTVQILNGLVNNGTWTLNDVPGGSTTTLNFNGTQTLSGTGQIVMSDSAGNRIVNTNDVLTHAAGHTIRGAGNLLAETGGMVNQGTIEATGTTALTIDPNGQGFVNEGTLSALGSGGIRLGPGTFTNSGHSIDVAAGSNLTLTTAVTLVGGTLNTAGTGIVTFEGSNNTLNGVTSEATIAHNDGLTQQITGGFVNNAVYNLSSSGAATTLNFNGTQTLSGTGEIVMSDNVNNRIVNTNDVLTHAADHTIRGAGQLGANTGGILNHGTILAQGTNALRIDPNGQTFTNRGTLRAEGTGGLAFNAGTFDNASHTIDVDDGSKLEIETAVTIVGGTLTTAGSGVVRFVDSNNTLNQVTSEALIEHGNDLTQQITGGFVNNNVYNLSSSGDITTLNFNGTQTLSGTGEIVLSDNANNRIVNTNDVLTQAAGHTIRGAGQLFANTGGFNNEGTVIADGVNELLIDVNGQSMVNNGTLRAEGSGGIRLNAGTFTNNTSIDVEDGSQLVLSNAAHLVGGVLNTAGSGVVLYSTSSNTLNGVTNEGMIQHDNALTQTVLNGLVNNGEYRLDSSGAITQLNFNGTQTLSGTGEIVMSDNANNRIVNTNDVLTQAAGHTIRGAGQLAANTGGFNNEGTVIADGVNELLIDVNGQSMVNNGTLRAEGSGGIRLNAGTFTNNTSIDVEDGSQLVLSNAAHLVGGVLNTAGSGVVRYSTSSNTLNGVTNEGVIQHDNALSQTVVNGFVNNGEYRLDSSGAITLLNFNGTQTLSGSGVLRMSDDANNRIINTNDVLTNAAGHTIEGAGNLLANTGGLRNDGTIRANAAANAIRIDVNGQGFVNSGLLHAQTAPGVVLADSFTNAGDVVVDAGSQINVTGQVNQTAGMSLVNGTLTTTLGLRATGGMVTGTGIIVGDVDILTGATFAPGDGGAGLLTVDGDYTQDGASTFEYELGGSTPGLGHDLLDVVGGSNGATLAGNIDVILSIAFAPALAIGDEFLVMTTASLITGLFDTINVNLAGFAFEQFLLDGGTDLALRVIEVAPTTGVPAPGMVMVLLVALGLLRARAAR